MSCILPLSSSVFYSTIQIVFLPVEIWLDRSAKV